MDDDAPCNRREIKYRKCHFSRVSTLETDESDFIDASPQSPNFPTNSLSHLFEIPICYLVMTTAELTANVAFASASTADNFGHVVTFYGQRAVINDTSRILTKFIIVTISYVSLQNNRIRAEIARIIKYTHSFISFRDREIFAQTAQTRMTESNSNAGKWFSRYCETFISLRIFFAIEEKSIRDGCPSRGLIRARCYRPRSSITLLILQTKKKTQRSFIVAVHYKLFFFARANHFFHNTWS